MTAIQRLTEQLDAKDEQLHQALEKLAVYEDAEKDAWKWTKHKALPKNQEMPVPRLEIRAVPIHNGDWSNMRWDYSLVIQHLLGDIIAIPLGQTVCNSSRAVPPIFNGEIHGPFRDGAHIQHEMESLKLPGFLVVEDGETVTRQIIVPSGTSPKRK